MSLEVVKRARAKYDHLEGEERAYHIVNEVAWNLKANGASLPEQAGQCGTFYKPSGANYNERSIDVIIYKPGGETYDILGDAEGIAKPQWTRTKPSGFGDVSKWRAAVPPIIVVPEPPEPEPEPEPEPPPTGDYITRADFEAYQREVDQQFRALRTEMHAIILKMETRILALEQKPAAAYMLIENNDAQPIGTSRNSLHAHQIRAAVVPKV